MNRKLVPSLLLALALAGCSSLPSQSQGLLGPVDAIRGAATASRGYPGRFVMKIQAVGGQSGHTYLNSERDYRDQLNLSVALPDALLPELEKQLGQPVRDLRGQRIVVRGRAQRVRIYFFDGSGQRSDKYYYQTHVDVARADQLALAP